MRGPKPITYAREVYSPSQLEMANRCLRSWVLRYVYGIKTQSAASRSKVLGTLIHKCVELYINGRSMLSLSVDDFDDYTRKEFTAFTTHREQVLFDKALKKNPYEHHAKLRIACQDGAQKELEGLFRDAPQRALAGLAHLPPLEQCAARFAEVPLQVSTTDFYDYDVAFSEMCKIDLVVQAASGEWYLYDHKSTKGGYRQLLHVGEDGTETYSKVFDPWLYVPAPEALKRNVQLLLYAAHVMQKQKVGELWCRWIYYYTGEGAPDSKAVDVHITYAEVAEYLRPWLELTDKLGWIIRDTLEKNQLPELAQFEFSDKINTDDSPCDAYGGCGYRGSHCNPPPLSAADILARTRAVKRESKGAESMSLDSRVAQMQANGAPVLPSVTPMQNPPGYNYTPNVNGQFVVAPPGHPAHTNVPAGYQYPPGAVPAAAGLVEVPVFQPQVLVPTQPTYTSQTGLTVAVPTLVEVPLAAIPDDPADLPMPEPEKPKRTRRTKAEIEAEKATQAFGPPAEGVTRIVASPGFSEGDEIRYRDISKRDDKIRQVADMRGTDVLYHTYDTELRHVSGLDCNDASLFEIATSRPTHIGRRDGMSAAGARGIDGAVETLAARSKELGCDIQVNIVMKGGQS